MNYVLINKIKVQNANAIAGFTWGFPAITHFLGYCHNLSRKLLKTEYNNILLEGCSVICHEHQTHTFRDLKNNTNVIQFTQSRNPPYANGLQNDKKSQPAPVIEEGKMNMTVSLLIGCEGNIGNRQNEFKRWLFRQCQMQRLAGGSVLSIEDINLYSDDSVGFRQIKFKLLPGFLLMDRSAELEKHYKNMTEENPDAELLDAWLDFSALKQKARPKADLIKKHFSDLKKTAPEKSALIEVWNNHLKAPYSEEKIPAQINQYFDKLEQTEENKKLIDQWTSYVKPTEDTDADWEYIPKPAKGYLVPIMAGYKAISKVYKNQEVQNTRDNETDVCFTEAVHSIGEWQSVHRLKDATELRNSLWHYHYEENWYLCKQGDKAEKLNKTQITEEDFS